MTLLTKDQADNIAGQMKDTGFTIGNYGGGSGETYHYNQNQVNPISQTKSPAVSLTAKIANIGKSVGGLAKEAASYVEHQPANIYHSAQPFLQGVADVVTQKQSRELGFINDQREQLDKNSAMYTAAYKNGKMQKDQYQRLMKDLGASYSALSGQSTKIAKTTSNKSIIESAAETAGLILSGGSLKSGSVTLNSFKTAAGAESEKLIGTLAAKKGASAFASQGGTDVLKTMLTDSGSKLEQAVSKIPTARNIVLKSMQTSLKDEAKQQLLGESTSQFLARQSKTLATALLIKDPLVYHLNIDSANNIYEEMSTGKYGAALANIGLQSLQLLEGPITAAQKVLKATGSKLRNLTYGNKSLIDETSKIIGNGKSDQIANYVKSGADVTSATGKTTMKAEEVFRYWQENVLRRASDDVKLGVSYGIENFTNAGVDLKYVKPEHIAQQILNHHEATLIMKQAAENGVKGLSKEDAQNLVVVRFDSMIKRAFANAIRQAGDDKQAMMQVLEGYKQTSGNGWVNNATLMTEFVHIIDEAPSAEAAAKRIESIPTAKALISGLPSKDAKNLAKLGYGLAVPEGGKRLSSYVTDYNDTRKLISSVTSDAETVTRTIPVHIPEKLKGLAKEAKSYNSIDDFVKAQKTKTVTEYKTITKELPAEANKDIPLLSASRSMSLGKPGVRGSTTAAYNTSDSNLDQIMRSSIIAAKGTAKTAEEHASALYEAGFSDADIKAIRDFAVSSADEAGKVDATKLGNFIDGRINSGAPKTTTERVATTTKAKVNEDDVRKAYELAHTEPTTETVEQAARDLFDPAVAPNPTLDSMAGFLTKAGLSPVEANQRAYQALSTSVAKAVDKLDVAQGLGFKGATGNEVLGGQVIMSKLEDWIQSRTPNKLLATVTGTFGKARPAITDVRQMTEANIRDALNARNTGIKISSQDAKQISSAIKQGYLDTPLELRGLGDKTVDYLYKYNPVQKYYSRIQSALRYSYNPFFQAQEAVETAAFSGLQGGNKATALLGNGLKWGKTRDELDATVAKLEDARIFSSSLGGEAASDQVLGRISADITKGQKRDLAGLAQSISSSQGRSIDDILENNPEQIEDALRVVVQYPKRGALSTPLARTLNLAFFPMRYNLKVTKLAGDILSKQPASVQFATVHSLLNLKNWLQSDEGIRWKAQNSDALQVFNWISPLNNIGSLFNTLGYLGDVATGQPNSGPGSLGQLGGLPFGMISQILDSEGIININSPYVEPRTGDVIPNYIPQTTKTKAATAIQDLLGSVFTYPGQTLGLPGKSALLRNATNAFGLDDKGGYLIQQYTTKDAQGNIQLTQKGQNELTPSQKNLIRVLAGDHSQDSLDSLYMDDKGMATLPPSVLPFSVPDKLPTLNKTQLAAAKASAKKTSNSTKRTKPVAQPLGIY